MKFTQHYTIKWHDTDANRQVRPSALVTYFQETANEHLIYLGVSLDKLRDTHGLAFILGGISVRVYEPLFAGDAIEVQTWVHGERGFRHNRCFSAMRDGKIVAEATSQWALVNLQSGSLVKVEDMPFQMEPDVAITISDLPPRLRMPQISDMELAGERRIVYSDIDYNGHMNNTRYPDMFCDFVPEICKKRVTGMVLSYRKGADFDHTLRVFRSKTESGYLFCTQDEDSSICTEAFVQLEPISDSN